MMSETCRQKLDALVTPFIPKWYQVIRTTESTNQHAQKCQKSIEEWIRVSTKYRLLLIIRNDKKEEDEKNIARTNRHSILEDNEIQCKEKINILSNMLILIFFSLICSMQSLCNLVF